MFVNNITSPDKKITQILIYDAIDSKGQVSRYQTEKNLLI